MLPLALSRNRTVPAPVGPNIAIQYRVPEVRLTGVMSTVFQAPAIGLSIVACASSVPGLLLAVLLYSPTTTLLAASL